MKKLLVFAITLSLLVFSLACAQAAARIAILQPMSHTSLDQILDTIVSSLEASGADVEIVTGNANGDSTALVTLLSNIQAEGVDILIPIATSTAQAARTVFEGTDTPIVFAAVSDPVAAGLTGEGCENITGVSNNIPAAEIVKLIFSFQPDCKKIGFLYTSSETNSVSTVNAAKAYCDEQGIAYDELSEADREAYEATFEDENGELPEKIVSSALNEWVFNEDTIRQVLHVLMTEGIKIDYGQKLGKTIIFAKNHSHAEKIYEIFNREYPHLPGFAKVIDNKIGYAQSLIDDFSDPKKLPQIAISVDMLDTGIDVPECLNLVFFKKVMSKAKFWQMIGRGTRLCPGLRDGADKDKFYIFDFCGNFEFFRMNNGKPTALQIALQGAVFSLKAQIAFKLQDIAYQTPELIAFRKTLVDDMVRKVQELNKENFAVRQHLKFVELYSNPDNYTALTYENTLQMRDELAPLITPDADEASAVRFDALMYGIELAFLMGKKYAKARTDLIKKVSGIASVANIPEIMVQSELIHKILHTDYLENAGINEFEHIRENLRDLIKYIPTGRMTYITNFADELISMDWNESELENDDLKNYKMKAEFYIRQNQDNVVIAKLKTNQPLTSADVKVLEEILWSEVGTKQDYENEYGSKPLGEFVREIVGLDMNAAKEAFAEYLDDASLDSNQIYFVNQIVEYIVHNGLMKDLSVLQDAPFTDNGSIVEVFTDLSVWVGIKKIIDQINANAIAA